MKSNKEKIDMSKDNVNKIINDLTQEEKLTVLLECAQKYVGSKEWAEEVGDLMKRMGLIPKEE